MNKYHNQTSISVKDAVVAADIILLAVPYGAMADALAEVKTRLAGKVVIDATNALTADYSGLTVGFTTSAIIEENKRKVTTHRLKEMKERGEKISMLTASDYSMASIIDEPGMDVMLVGDSASNVMAGNVTTLPLTIDQMIYHGRSVMKAVKRALVLVDMPFGTCSGIPEKSLDAAIRIMKETGADTLKIEGGEEIIEDIRKIINAGKPVMGHLGLMPQSINKIFESLDDPGSHAVQAFR